MILEPEGAPGTAQACSVQRSGGRVVVRSARRLQDDAILVVGILWVVAGHTTKHTTKDSIFRALLAKDSAQSRPHCVFLCPPASGQHPTPCAWSGL